MDAPSPLRVLILDDDGTTVALYSQILTKQGWEAIAVRSIREAHAALATTTPDVAIVDVYLTDEDGLDFVRWLRANMPEVGIAVVSSEDTQTLADKALKSGADYFLSKPIAPSALVLTVQRIDEYRTERQRAGLLQRELRYSLQNDIFPRIITQSDIMRGVLKLVEKVAPRELAVLVCGESGTGKELIARAVHELSSRAGRPFVDLNCAALPPNLVESELFGHEKGSFTGAIATRIGKMEAAHGGTLFLDEIGEMPLDMQPKLLRALEEKCVTRVGGKKEIPCDFRLVSATNRDLSTEVREGRFREDLFYRIAVFPIKLPPLRERMEDLELLLTYFLESEGVKNPRITPEARAALHRYNWPGNVRELRHFAQAVGVLSDGGVIDEQILRNFYGYRMETVGAPAMPGRPNGESANGHLRPPRRLEDVEREEIHHALRYHKGDVGEAARSLGMGRATLYKYIKKESIRIEDFLPRPKA